ncbi:NAD(P)-dependent oxidoreductase [Paenibacillus sp. JX-17]|uniref:NAD(P)-dependent oxidoreductase n=1 Tax=Paenibacillus lacisoli TaxID=3064525 RepID=A0ABT9CA66_9BACL|nr:NAD(P)-dependent oxidoreductase [Paenibacillus sp. JX-17]MDO7906136.1 NAD(P)-dependent oxidoreductase [Paenibacillus sp. JX-17]
MKPTIGWIGLGNMGLPMAQNIIRAGYPLRVNNRTASKADPLVEEGAVLCSTPREVAQQSDIIVLMLSNNQAVEAVLHGEDGLLSGLDEQSIVVNMSTISPDEMIAAGQLLTGYKARFVEAPVSGSVKPAEDGQLVILAGGQAEAVEHCMPIFDVLGKQTLHFGEVGTGSRAKLVINLLLGITMQGISEALVLADKAGLDRELVLKMVGASAVHTPLLAGKTQSLLSGDFPAAFALKWMEKDLGYAVDLARKLEASLPLASAVTSTYTSAKANGRGEMDMASILLQIEELSGMKRKG